MAMENTAALKEEMARMGHAVERVVPIGAGHDCTAYLLNSEYVVKVPASPEAYARLKKELAICGYLDSCDLGVTLPKPIGLSETLGIMTYIRGENLTYAGYQVLSDADKEQLARDEAAFLQALHAVPFDVQDTPFKGFVENKREAYTSDKAGVIKVLAERNRLDKATLHCLNAYYDALFACDFMFNYSPCLVHNDFSADNMIFRFNRLYGVVDFGDSLIGDPDNDFFCILDSSTDDFGKDFGRLVLKHYRHPNPAMAEKKAAVHDSYWPLQQILIGSRLSDDTMLNDGYCQLRRLEFPAIN